MWLAVADEDDDDDQVHRHAQNASWFPQRLCMGTGFLCFFPIQKIPLWDDKFGTFPVFTKIDPI